MRYLFLILFGIWSLPLYAGNIYLFAAASTQVPLQQAAQLYEQKTGHRIRLTFASTGTLARQIEQGAPAMLFLSANHTWVDSLKEKGVLKEGEVIEYLSNQLVLIAPLQSKTLGSWPQDLPQALKNTRLALADPQHAPAGFYAKEALQNLGLWDSIQPRLALGQNVRASLAWVERGEAEFGIVYQSDAQHSKKIKVLCKIDPKTHSPIRYQLALTAKAGPEAKDFYQFLQTEKIRLIFSNYGFTQP